MGIRIELLGIYHPTYRCDQVICWIFGDDLDVTLQQSRSGCGCSERKGRRFRLRERVRCLVLSAFHISDRVTHTARAENWALILLLRAIWETETISLCGGRGAAWYVTSLIWSLADIKPLKVERVAAVCNNTIVVVHSVGPVSLTWSNHPNVTGIVFAGAPGEQTGPSIVDILYGHSNPSGKLPYSIADVCGFGHWRNLDSPLDRTRLHMELRSSITAGQLVSLRYFPCWHPAVSHLTHRM